MIRYTRWKLNVNVGPNSVVCFCAVRKITNNNLLQLPKFYLGKNKQKFFFLVIHVIKLSLACPSVKTEGRRHHGGHLYTLERIGYEHPLNTHIHLETPLMLDKLSLKARIQCLFLSSASCTCIWLNFITLNFESQWVQLWCHGNFISVLNRMKIGRVLIPV